MATDELKQMLYDNIWDFFEKNATQNTKRHLGLLDFLDVAQGKKEKSEKDLLIENLKVLGEGNSSYACAYGRLVGVIYEEKVYADAGVKMEVVENLRQWAMNPLEKVVDGKRIYVTEVSQFADF